MPATACAAPSVSWKRWIAPFCRGTAACVPSAWPEAKPAKSARTPCAATTAAWRSLRALTPPSSMRARRSSFSRRPRADMASRSGDRGDCRHAATTFPAATLSTKWPGISARVLRRAMPATTLKARVSALRLLNRRHPPMAAAHAHEGPHFGGFVRPALQHAAAVAIEGLVLERKTHRDGGVVGGAPAPSLGEIALQQLDVGDAIDDALARILGQFLREVGQHFGRDEPAQPRQIFGAVGALHLAKGLFESIEVVRREPDVVGAGCARLRSRSTAAEPHLRTRVAGGVIAQCRAAGERRLAAALPPRPDQIADDHNEANLQHQAKHRGEAAEAAQETMAEQHAEQAGAEETREQAAEEAGPIEEATNGRRYRRALRERAARLARLRHAAFDRPRARRCRRRRRRGKCLRAAAAEAAAATGAGIGIGHREGQHRRHGAKRKQRTNAQEKHGNPPRKPVWSTKILVSHDGIVRGAAWCRRPLTCRVRHPSARPREGHPATAKARSRASRRAMRGNERWRGRRGLFSFRWNNQKSVSRLAHPRRAGPWAGHAAARRNQRATAAPPPGAVQASR